MSDLSSENPVVAIAVSDLHITADSPIARSGEPSWAEVLKRQFDQLKQISFEHSAPIICAGDIFDRWNTPAEGISLALEYMPRVYAVPGQHDLPYHSLEGIHRTAYGVLMRAGKIENLEQGSPRVVAGPPGCRPLRLHGYPWGTIAAPKTQNPPRKDSGCLEIAVVHAYCWFKEAKHPEAAPMSELSCFGQVLKGFDVAVFGDNHKPFNAQTQTGCQVINCGSFFRRKSDEYLHQPRVGLIHQDGSIESLLLDVSKDIGVAESKEKWPTTKELLSVSEFVENLRPTNKHSFDFVEALRIYRETHKLSAAASKLLHQLTKDES